MYTLVKVGDLKPTPSGTRVFEGQDHGSGVSMYLVNAAPGGGPVLHRHPYSETWLLRAGRAEFTADGQVLLAGPGDMLVVGPHTPHKFKNIGDERLELICIHASPTFIQEDLE
jgi:mannose-6-phosphate isomerase-like protein (cupin superfamily)